MESKARINDQSGPGTPDTRSGTLSTHTLKIFIATLLLLPPPKPNLDCLINLQSLSSCYRIFKLIIFRDPKLSTYLFFEHVHYNKISRLKDGSFVL